MISNLGAPPFLTGLLSALLLGLLCVAFGRRLLRALGVREAGFWAWELGFLQLALGVGLLQLLPYGLGAAQKLSERNVLLGLLVLALVLSRDLWAVSARAAGCARDAWQNARQLDASARAWLVLFGALLTFLLVPALVLGPFADDDGYHLSAPKRWLSSGKLGYLATYTITNASMGFEMLYVVVLSLAGAVAVKIVHYSAGVATCFGIWLVARRLGSGTAGRLAISLLLVATPFCNLPVLFRIAYVDFGPTWMAATAILLWLVWRETGQSRLLVALALCVGFAGSFKTTSLSLAAAWAPVLVWEARRRGLTWPRIAGYATGLGCVALLPVLPWSFRSWQVTGNPVFPLLSGLIPTRDFSGELAGIFGRFMHYYSWGVASGASLDESARKRIVLVTLLVVLATSADLYRWLRTAVLRPLLVLSSVFTLIAVAVAGMVFRYWLPGLVGLVLVVCVELLNGRVSRVVAARAASAVMAVALAVQLLRPRGPDEPWLSSLSIAAGVSTPARAYAHNPFWQMWDFINTRTPPDSRVLMVSFYTSFGASSYGAFWVDRACMTTDSHLQETIALRDWPSFLASLSQLGVTHVLLADREVIAPRQGFSYDAQLNEYSFGRRVADDRGERLAAFGALELYRLRGAAWPPLAGVRP